MTDVTTVVNTMKAVVSTIQAVNNAPLNSQIIELQIQVMELITQNMELQRELADTKALLTQRQSSQSTGASLQFDRGAYWSGPSREPGADGPFCSVCWDDLQKQVRMAVQPNPGYAKCGKCGPKAQALLIWPEKDIQRGGGWGTSTLVRG